MPPYILVVQITWDRSNYTNFMQALHRYEYLFHRCNVCCTEIYTLHIFLPEESMRDLSLCISIGSLLHEQGFKSYQVTLQSKQCHWVFYKWLNCKCGLQNILDSMSLISYFKNTVIKHNFIYQLMLHLFIPETRRHGLVTRIMWLFAMKCETLISNKTSLKWRRLGEVVGSATAADVTFHIVVICHISPPSFHFGGYMVYCLA